ncbi:MAG TPA: hypothetical protein PK730_05250, partial [Candidatus Cloacimonas acidaminovorans]|nr:hypothetical protein [Candidatus Cloacimonas acidaminovorans]
MNTKCISVIYWDLKPKRNKDSCTQITQIFFEVLIYDYNLVDEEKSGLVTAEITFTPFTNSF